MEKIKLFNSTANLLSFLVSFTTTAEANEMKK